MLVIDPVDGIARLRYRLCAAESEVERLRSIVKAQATKLQHYDEVVSALDEAREKLNGAILDKNRAWRRYRRSKHRY